MPDNPFPRAMEGGCCDCGGPVHAYSHMSLREDGAQRCDECTRRLEKRMGKDPRQFFKNFFWKHGHDPNDEDADPDSPFFYLKLEAHEEDANPNQKEDLSGPESGVWCFNCLCRGRKVMTRLVAEVDPYSLLEPTGYKTEEATVKTTEKVVMVICPECTAVNHWREEAFKRERTRQARI